MFSALKRNLKSRITHLIYNIAATRYEAQTWTRTTQCQNCQKQISIDAHYCMYCGGHVVAPSAVSKVGEISEIASPMDHIFSIADVQFQNTDPICIDKVAALMSSPDSTTRRFLKYARSYNGQHISPLAMQHRQRQDRERV